MWEVRARVRYTSAKSQSVPVPNYPLTNRHYSPISNQHWIYTVTYIHIKFRIFSDSIIYLLRDSAHSINWYRNLMPFIDANNVRLTAGDIFIFFHYEYFVRRFFLVYVLLWLLCSFHWILYFIAKTVFD